LYAGALAVIYPINFDEPFGLVMVEAMASGTPVIALDRGSVKELVLDGETGLVDSSIDNLAKRVNSGALDKIKGSACVERVKGHFSKESMSSNYEALYKRVLSAEPVLASV